MVFQAGNSACEQLEEGKACQKVQKSKVMAHTTNIHYTMCMFLPSLSTYYLIIPSPHTYTFNFEPQSHYRIEEGKIPTWILLQLEGFYRFRAMRSVKHSWIREWQREVSKIGRISKRNAKGDNPRWPCKVTPWAMIIENPELPFQLSSYHFKAPLRH